MRVEVVDQRLRASVRHTDIRMACARTSAQVRLPAQTLHGMTAKRMASSARQLVASSPG
jgi:hypothetical protein